MYYFDILLQVEYKDVDDEQMSDRDNSDNEPEDTKMEKKEIQPQQAPSSSRVRLRRTRRSTAKMTTRKVTCSHFWYLTSHTTGNEYVIIFFFVSGLEGAAFRSRLPFDKMVAAECKAFPDIGNGSPQSQKVFLYLRNRIVRMQSSL